MKQFQNKAASKSDVVLNVFLDAFTKVFSSDPECFISQSSTEFLLTSTKVLCERDLESVSLQVNNFFTLQKAIIESFAFEGSDISHYHLSPFICRKGVKYVNLYMRMILKYIAKGVELI